MEFCPGREILVSAISLMQAALQALVPTGDEIQNASPRNRERFMVTRDVCL